MPGWPPAAPPEAGAPAHPRTACVTTVSTMSGRRVSQARDDVTHDQNTISAQKLLPEQLPLEDDNSDFTLQGYQNFLIEPLVKFLFYTLRTTSNVILRSDVMTETC